MSEGFKPFDHAGRRSKFFSEIEKGADGVVAVIPANPELIRNSDVGVKFRQESNFFFLTGFDEPDAIAVFRSVGGKRQFTLFVRPKDLEKEIWTGFRCGVDGAVTKYGADQAFKVEEFDTQFPKLLAGAQRVFYGFSRTGNRNGVEALDTKMLRLIESYRAGLGRSGKGLLQIHDPHEVLGEMRLFKTPDELQRMRKVAQISALAHREAMCRVKPGLNESQVEALLEYVFRNSGADRHSFPSIVAGGANATVLHYVENNQKLNANDMVLVDAGAELEYYAADITRTYPVSGKMTKEQREVYEAVLKVQKQCIAMAKPGITLVDIHTHAVEQLTEAMLAMKLLKGDRKKLIEDFAYKRYYPHNTSHFMGMDVHDVGLYQADGKPRPLEPGMVFTIEPGFYVLKDDTQAPAAYRGIGVRIEDDVLITANGAEVLTSGAPKEVDEMLAIIGTKPWLET